MKYLAIVGTLILIGGVGFWLAMPKTAETPEPEANGTVMESDTGLEIVTEDAVAYYAEAKGFYAEPKEPGVYPGIVMIHENRGLRPEIKKEAEELAKEGYRVLAVDLYKGTVMETQEEARAYRDKYKQEDGLANMQAAVAYLENKGAEKIASLGWCFGGRQSVELAISGTPLDATVVYYGGGMATTTDKLAAISWPVLGVFGDQDQVIPLSEVEAFKASLGELGIQNEVYIYPGVGHAFANPSNPNFAPEPTADAWSKTLTFLETHLR